MSNQLKYDNLIIVADDGQISSKLSVSTFNGALPRILAPYGDKTVFEHMLQNIEHVATEIYIMAPVKYIKMLKQIAQKVRPDIYETLTFTDFIDFAGVAYNVCAEVHVEDLIGTALIVDSNTIDADTLSLRMFCNLNRPLMNREAEEYSKEKHLEVSLACSEFRTFPVLFDDSGFTFLGEDKGNVLGVYAVNDISILGFFYDLYTGNDYLAGPDAPGLSEMFDHIEKIDWSGEPFNLINVHYFAENMKVYTVYSDDSVKNHKLNKVIQHNPDCVVEQPDILVKYASTVDIDKELNTYSFYESMGLDNYFPDVKIFTDKYLEVENPGMKVSEYLSSITDNKEYIIAGTELFKKFRRFIDPFHKTFVSDDDHVCMNGKRSYKAIYQEYIYDLQQMYERNYSVLNSVTVNRVNGTPIPNFEYLIERLKDFIDYEIKDIDFSVIHGNTLAQNICFDDKGTGKFKMINPKPYFGGVDFYGDPYKDLALFATDIIGGLYLKNEVLFRPTITCNDLSVSFNSPVIFGIYVRNSEHEIVIACIYWLKLVDQFANQPIKAISIFYSGLKMLNEALTSAEY